MFIIALLYNKNWVILDHANRKMYHLPAHDTEYPIHIAEVSNEEVARYLYEHTNKYSRNELIKFEE